MPVNWNINDPANNEKDFKEIGDIVQQMIDLLTEQVLK